MSNLSDFLALGGSGAVKTAYYTTSGTKTLVPYDGVDKLVYIVRGENDGYWDAGAGNPVKKDIIKSVSDLTLDVTVGQPAGVIESFAAPSVSVYGISYDDASGNMITSSAANGTISIHSGISATVSSSFASPGTNPWGIVVDQRTGDLISCDPGTDTISIHDGITSTVLSSFPAPGANITDITIDYETGNLISADRSSGDIPLRLWIHSL